MSREDYMRIPELLAPVGSMDYLKVAINAGASSVYLSGKNYGARKFADNEARRRRNGVEPRQHGKLLIFLRAMV